jgi:hypothetical protein
VDFIYTRSAIAAEAYRMMGRNEAKALEEQNVKGGGGGEGG